MQAQESLNEMMAKRVRMLEFAIQHERAMRTAGSVAPVPSVDPATSLLPPVPVAPPSAGAPLRASQVIIRDYLLSLGYEPDALVDVYTSGNLDAIAAARKAGIAHLRLNTPKRAEPKSVVPAAISNAQPADSAIGVAPSPESKKQRPWTLHRRGASALRSNTDSQISDAASSTPTAATNGAQAAGSARVDPPAQLAAVIQQSAGDIATSRFSSKLSSSVTKRNANNAIPLTWIPGIPARSHMDVIRYVEWIPQNELTATAATSMLHIPTMLTCSDDGTAKVWASTLHGRHATPGYAFANPTAGSTQLPAALSTHLSVHKEAEMEPLRTLRGHTGAVLSGCTVSWTPLSKEVTLGDIALCSAERLITAFLSSRSAKAEASAKLLECSSKGSLLITAGLDGMVCVWAKPNDCIVLPAERDPSWPPSILPLAYDLPAEACIPMCKFNVSPGPVWCVGRVPPGYCVADVASLEMHEHLARMDSMQAPLFYTIGDDQVLRFWVIGASTKRVAPVQLSELDLKPWLGTARTASAAVDPTSTKLAIFIATTQGTILKVAASERLLLFTTRAPAEEATLARITCLATHPLMPLLFASHDVASIGVAAFETASGKCVGVFVSHSSSTTSLSVDPTGLMLATSGNDGDVRVWSIETKECVWRQRVRNNTAPSISCVGIRCACNFAFAGSLYKI
jgi:WD40 repeat protein